MAAVDALKSKQDIDLLKTYLKAKNIRYYLLFVVGINTGLRIGDILRLCISDFVDEKRHAKKYLDILEQKTGKTRRIAINATLLKAFKLYQSTFESEIGDYLFRSRKGCNKPLTTTQAYRILTDAAIKCNISINFGTHTMRKTWGYWTYKATGNNIGLVMDMLNHSSPAITLRYIGITQEQKDNTYMMVEI